MKNVLLTVGFAAITGLVFGQTNGISKNFPRKDAKNVFVGTANTVVNGNTQRAILWQDDFSTPGNWTIANGAGNGDNWVIGTAIPAGAFPIAGIASTSAANGFALFDSDLLCSGNQAAWIQNTTPIDLSASPAVILQFEQFYRKFTDDVFVQVSNNGTTWTDFEVNSSVPSNGSTTNPDIESLNITSVAGGQATVYIRFYFLSGAANGGDGCDYAWMVDDVKIIDAPANDLLLGDVYYGEYSRYPVGQELPIEFSGKITNFGGAAQTNVTLAASINATPFATSTPIPSLAVSTTDSLVVPGTYTPAGAGTYTITFTADQTETDADLTNNTATRTVQVTNYTFARDNNTYTGAGLWNQAGMAYIMGNYFQVSNAATATSIDVVLQGNTVAGAEFRVLLLNDLVNSTPEDGVVAESDFYTVATADISTGSTAVTVNVPFIVPVDIEAGDYFAMIDFGGGTSDLVLANGSDILQPEQTTFIYDTDGIWYFLTSTPMVRMNINEPNSNSIAENAKTSGITVFPNPATDVVNVKFAEINGDVTLQLFSNDGKQVQAGNANVVAGQTTTVDVSGLAAGIYTLRVTGANGTYSQKVIVK